MVHRFPFALGLIALLTPPVKAADAPAVTVAYFSELQERGPSTQDELADRAKTSSAEAAAADSALNDWKLCVVDAVNHWAELGAGPGTLVDGAYGRCGDLERTYREKLMAVKQGGRLLIDYQFARTLMKALEDAWRLRLIAMALDQELARKAAAPPASGKPRG